MDSMIQPLSDSKQRTIKFLCHCRQCGDAQKRCEERFLHDLALLLEETGGAGKCCASRDLFRSAHVQFFSNVEAFRGQKGEDGNGESNGIGCLKLQTALNVSVVTVKWGIFVSV